jgi:hypothetical protein
MVIRTVWIAAFCLAGLGGLFATKVTASIPEETVGGPTTVGTSLAQDTLTKADKLPVTYLLHPESIPVLPTEPIAAEIVPTKPTTTAKIASLHPSGPSAYRTAVLLPKPRPKIAPAKHAKDVGLAKAAVDPNCHQQDGLGGILISLSGSPRCEL